MVQQPPKISFGAAQQVAPDGHEPQGTFERDPMRPCGREFVSADQARRDFDRLFAADAERRMNDAVIQRAVDRGAVTVIAHGGHRG